MIKSEYCDKMWTENLDFGKKCCIFVGEIERPLINPIYKT